MIVLHVATIILNVAGITGVIYRRVKGKSQNMWSKVIECFAVLYSLVFLVTLSLLGLENILTIVLAIVSIKIWATVFFPLSSKELQPQRISHRLEKEVVTQLNIRHHNRSEQHGY